jgi:hypothetical protein
MYIYYDGDELARNAASGELTPVAELPHDAVRIVITYVDTWPP